MVTQLTVHTGCQFSRALKYKTRVGQAGSRWMVVLILIMGERTLFASWMESSSMNTLNFLQICDVTFQLMTIKLCGRYESLQGRHLLHRNSEG
jgi:hypothetical protein